MQEKEKNFISAVIYLGEEKACVEPFLKMLISRLGARFQNYELVFVEDASRDGTEEEVRKFLKKMEKTPLVTVIHMSLRQGKELAMNAGLDMAIGDFVYEFDTMKMPYPEKHIDKAYDMCLAGNDIISVSPVKNRRGFSSLFYKLFNSSSNSKYKIQTDVFRLLSRRAINRVHSISPTLPYRKAAYAASGLKLEVLAFEGEMGTTKEEMRMGLAMDSLVLYTGIGYKVSFGIAGIMLLVTLAEIVYTLVMFLGGGKPIEGWTTTMLVLTAGFFGVFLILAIVLKYLALLIDLVFKKQKYLVESVEKLT